MRRRLFLRRSCLLFRAWRWALIYHLLNFTQCKIILTLTQALNFNFVLHVSPNNTGYITHSYVSYVDQDAPHLTTGPECFSLPQISLPVYHVTQHGRDCGSLWVQWAESLATRRLVCVFFRIHNNTDLLFTSFPRDMLTIAEKAFDTQSFAARAFMHPGLAASRGKGNRWK
jgi:hypothetical protein